MVGSYLHSVGLLRASFRPDQAICALRSIYRYRQNLRTLGAQHIQHMHAAMDQMNIKLHHVIDDLTGVTGMAIIEDILKGQRDPLQLAKHRNYRIKASENTIVKALEGDWRVEHLFVLRLAWENWKQTQHQIEICDQQLLDYTRQMQESTFVAKPSKIVRVGIKPTPSNPALQPKKLPRKKTKNEPPGPWHEELQRFFGVDLTAIPGISVLSAMSLMSELGNDLSAFKSPQHFSSWLCLCPDNQTSASKVLSRRTRRSTNRLRQTLRMAASTLYRDKSFLGDTFRRLRAKLGAPKAITAIAHKLARIIWHLLTYRVAFDISIFAAQEQANQIQRLKRLTSNARKMGYQLTPITASNPCPNAA
jgi:transposase